MTMTLKDQLNSYNKDKKTILVCDKCNHIELKYYDYESSNHICQECGNPIIKIVNNKVINDIVEAYQSVEMAYNKKYREGKIFNLVEYSIGIFGEVKRTVIQCRMGMNGDRWYKYASYYIINKKDLNGYGCGIFDEHNMYKPWMISYEIDWEKSRGVIFTFENEREEEARRLLIDTVKSNLNQYIESEEVQLKRAKTALKQLN